MLTLIIVIIAAVSIASVIVATAAVMSAKRYDDVTERAYEALCRKSTELVLIAALAFLAFSPTDAKAECLPSAQAVWQTHGGHATWRNVDGHRCWMAGYGHGQRHVARVPAPREKPRQFVKEAELRSLFPERPAQMNPEAAYAEGLRMLKAHFAQKAKVVEAGR